MKQMVASRSQFKELYRVLCKATEENMEGMKHETGESKKRAKGVGKGQINRDAIPNCRE